jgi:hypothetical protein
MVDLDGDVLRLTADNPIVYNGRSVDTTVTWRRAGASN